MSRRDFFREQKIKKAITTSTITLLLVVIACVTLFVMYSKSLDNQAKEEYLAVTNEKSDIVPNNSVQATSSTKDKTAKNMTENKIIENKTVENKQNENNVIENKSENIINTISKNVVTPIVTPEEKNVISNSVTDQVIEQKELNFQAPVNGEILKDFAMETLVFSQTLGEWCTHSGIDIKANKTSIVVASEDGVVSSIKNDPRYGLTVIIQHDDGYKTVYSNLLTTEFVKEGENVEKGQTIATVGDTASFEVLDESHLHFEMYKDDIAVNPTIYLK